MRSLARVLRDSKRLIVGCVIALGALGIVFAFVSIKESSSSQAAIRFDRVSSFAITHDLDKDFFDLKIDEEKNLVSSGTYQRESLGLDSSSSLAAKVTNAEGPLELTLTTESDASDQVLDGAVKAYLDDLTARMQARLTSRGDTVDRQLEILGTRQQALADQLAGLDPATSLLAQALDAERARNEGDISKLRNEAGGVMQATSDLPTMFEVVGPRHNAQAGLWVRRLAAIVSGMIAGLLLALGLAIITWLTQGDTHGVSAPPS
jgi:hypothetical protein